MTDALQLRDNARHELEQIRDLESGIDYLNKVKAIEVWAKAEQKDAELQNMVAEQKLRTQRILGQLIKEGQENGELATSTSSQFSRGREQQPRKTLADVGLNKDQSKTFRAIASIPEETFEEFITEKKQAVKTAVTELTTTGAVRLAKTLQERRTDANRVADLNNRLDMERELRNLAIELRKKYKTPQIEMLVQFLTK